MNRLTHDHTVPDAVHRGRRNRRAYRDAPVSDAHRLVHFLHAQLVLHGMSRREFELRLGVGKRTTRHWWDGRCLPSIPMMDAALGVFGYRLKPGAAPEAKNVTRLPRAACQGSDTVTL